MEAEPAIARGGAAAGARGLAATIGPDAAAGDAGAARYTDPPASIPRLVSDAWHSRHLLVALAQNIVARMYTRTYLGRAWLFIRPAMDAAGGALLFGGILSVSSQDGTPYALFFAAGIMGWRVFERTVLWVTRSFDRLGRLTRRLEVPLLLVPIGSISPALVDLAFYLLVVILIALGYLALDGQLWLQFNLETLAAVGGVLLILVFGLAIGLFTSVINAHTRDIRHALRYVMQIAMFATPVIYPISRLPEAVRPVAQANPLSAPIELVKHGLLGSGDVQLVPVLWSCTAAALLLAGGLRFFSRRATNFMGPAGWEADDDEDDPLL